MSSFRFVSNTTPRVTAPRIGTTQRISVVPSRNRRFMVVTNAKKDKDKDDIFKRTKNIIKNRLEADKIELDTLFSELTADSLDIVEVMMALEEEFDIQLDDEKSAKITNVEEAVDLIQSTIEEKAKEPAE